MIWWNEAAKPQIGCPRYCWGCSNLSNGNLGHPIKEVSPETSELLVLFTEELRLVCGHFLHVKLPAVTSQ